MTFKSFLAGFFDAEGSVYFHRKKYGGGFEISLSNTDSVMLETIGCGLQKAGYHPYLEQKTQDPGRLGYKLEGEISVLRLFRREEVYRFLKEMPFRHPEKLSKKEFIVRIGSANPDSKKDSVNAGWDQLLESIRAGFKEFIEEAKNQLNPVG
jgi:intein-encoded DNA endonuclease-like protein